MLGFGQSYRHIGKTVGAALVFAGFALHDGGVSAQQQQATSLARLEEAFWLCDYVATNQGVDATPIAACSDATEELKNDRFGGDFLALLRWWQDNRAAQHKRLSTVVD